MITNLFNLRKIFAILILVMYAMTFSTPVMAAATKPTTTMKSQVSKPALRGSEFSEMKLEGEIALSKGNPKITLSLRDSDVQQVLRMFADKAGLNIVFHSSVDGGKSKVTMDLVNVPLNDAFKLVMQVADLTYFIDKNTMIVASAEAAKDLNIAKQEMYSIPVKYVDASTIATFLNKNIYTLNRPGLSTSEIAVTNPSANEILIFGTPNDAKIARKVIEKFDIKPTSSTFTVKHTTPKEMSDMICKMLLPAAGAGTATGGAANSSSDIALGESTIACKIENKVTAGKLSSFENQSLSVAYFPQRGTVTVTGGSVQQINLIKDFVEKNDQKQPQALLEISIIELNESGSREFHNSWNVFTKFFSGSFSGGTTGTNPVFPTFVKGESFDTYNDNDPSDVNVTYKKFSGNPTVTWSFNYIIQNGKGRVLSNPKLLITNGQQSTIDMTGDYIEKSTGQILNSGTLSGAVQREYTIGEDLGLKIEMVPFISPEGYITLNIKPDYSTVKEQLTSTDENGNVFVEATLLQRNNLELNNIRIKDGETLVIGGLITENETKSVGKIPVLGDIPGIGAIFRDTTTKKTRYELVFMITPRMLNEDDNIANKVKSDEAL